jgi:hypothetical protein
MLHPKIPSLDEIKTAGTSESPTESVTMKQDTIIAIKHLPLRNPVGTLLLWWLALDHFQAPNWLYGVAFTILALYTAVWLQQLLTARFVKIVDGKLL